MKKNSKRKKKTGRISHAERLAAVKNPLVRAFAGRVMRWRKEKGLTLKDIARELDLSVSIVCEWEHGNRFPSVDHLLDLSLLMGVPAWSLLREASGGVAKKAPARKSR